MKKHTLTIILVLNFASEIVHGILFHELGTGEYAPITVGELLRGTLLVLLIGHALLHIRHTRNKTLVMALWGLGFVVCVQALLFDFGLGEVVDTLLRGLRWLYLFFVMSFASFHVSRRDISPERVTSLIKRLIVVFYCIPIFLSTLGVAGYTAYGATSGRKGYVGFIMNQNVVASMFVFMSPFYLNCDGLRDYLLLLVYLGAALLLGSKLVYGGLGGVLALTLTWRALGVLFSLRLRKRTLVVLVLLAALAVALPFTAYFSTLLEIFSGLHNLFTWYMSGGMGYESSFIDVLTSHRTWRLYRFLDWAAQPLSFPALFMGGGVPNYRLLYAEVDWIDLIALFGVAGLLLFYGILAYLLLRIYKTKRRPYRAETLAMLLLSVGISFTSGHTYDGPVVGIVIGCVLGAFFADDSSRATGPLPKVQSELALSKMGPTC